MREPLESHGYRLDWDAIYTCMWDLAESDDGGRTYRSEGERALKWLIADLTGTPAASGQTLSANNGLRKQIHRIVDDSPSIVRQGERTFHLSDPPVRTEPNSTSRHVLVTWNPGPDDDEQYTPEAWDEFAERVQVRPVHGRWSVGQRKQGIDPGDHAYLLRQGTHGRGIVASGVVTSTPYEAEGFREGQASARYVAIEWRRALPLDDALTVDDLMAAVPDYRWDSVFGSGREVKHLDGARLREAWLAHLGEKSAGGGTGSEEGPVIVVVDPRGKPVGAGFGSAEQNAKVERAAMRCVIAAYKADGWRHRDVSKEKVGWDVTFTKSDQEHHVEIKGVAGSKTDCFVTANELRKAG